MLLLLFQLLFEFSRFKLFAAGVAACLVKELQIPAALILALN
jgi:hypothetical protein